MRVTFSELSDADLHIDTVYAGGPESNLSADPIAKLLPVGNQGGFRFLGSPRQGSTRVAVLFTTGQDINWPDVLDPQTGVFTYWGDNKKPGTPLHETRRGGNVLLRDVFDWSSSTAADRLRVPPFLVFERAGSWDVRFRGLAVPGAANLSADDELVAVWRSTAGQRFQNYRARFTVLDVATVEREWLMAVINGQPQVNAPPEWVQWIAERRYQPLLAAKTVRTRSRDEQVPHDVVGREMLRSIHQYFADDPHGFEGAAIAIWRLLAPSTGRCEVTRRSRDGGVDAWGLYHLGPPDDPIAVEFALEAKCYAPTHGVGVRETSRLISRIRVKQFGVFATTSYFNAQAYDEVRRDGHPIVMICGGDIVSILRTTGFGDVQAVNHWLNSLSAVIN